jgi:AraC family ethanolamine operon transcriptional activator
MPSPLPDEESSGAINHRKTRDVDELAAFTGKLDQVYEQITPGRFNGQFIEFGFRGINLFRERTDQGTYQAGVMAAGSRMFGVAASVQGEGTFCGHPITMDMLATIDSGDEFDHRTPDVLDVLCLSVSSDLLAQYTFDDEQDGIARAVRKYPLVAAGGAQVARFRDALLTLQHAVCRTPDLLGYEAIQKGFEHAALSAVVEVCSSVSPAARRPPSLAARHSIVRRAQDHMRAHAEDPLTVEDICLALGVSRRTLQYSFQEILQVKPAAYLRALRLNGVRRALKSADPARDAVQDIAARWGFWHLSNFAGYYRRMFGELPSQTLHGRHVLKPLPAVQ